MPKVSWSHEPDVRRFQRAVLSKGRDRGITDIGPTKMLGLLYLLDVEYMSRYGEQATNVAWQWREYGPFQVDAAYEPRNDSEVEELPYSGPYEGSVYRLISDETFELEERIDVVLADVIELVGRMTGSQIKTYCYRNTAPMIEIQRAGDRGQPLDLSLARSEGSPVDPEAVQALKSVVSAIGGSRPSANIHSDEFLETIDAGEGLRDRATRSLLHNT